jgi:TPR repeat protein
MQGIMSFRIQGLPVAQHNIGFLYETGFGVPKNETEAAKWFRMAAETIRTQPGLSEVYSFFRGLSTLN